MCTARRLVLMAGMASALAAAGCGGGSSHATNAQRPPSTLSVSAALTTRGLAVSPSHFGAGPVNFLIANLTSRSVDVTLDDVTGTQATSSSGPINPNGTGRIATTVEQGTYRLSAGGRTVTIAVGPQRPSAQSDLNLP